MARWLLRRRLPLARRHRPETGAAVPAERALGDGTRAQRIRHARVHGLHARDRCRALLRRQPRFGTPQELRDWIEYCNHGSGTTLSDERIANGAENSFDIRYWGIGNENWGLRGRISPQEYAEQYSRFRTFAFPFGGTPVYAIASGANGSDWDWTRGFLQQLQASSQGSGNRLASVQAMAAHYYCGTAGTATDFSDDQWYELLAKAAAIEGIVTGHRQLMDEVDPERKIGLILDEWGAWHPEEEGKPRRGLYQQNSMRDAVVAALSLDVFHNHADKLVMANIAQLINVLQSLLLVDETSCIKTPTFHVFALYASHRRRSGGRGRHGRRRDQ